MGTTRPSLLQQTSQVEQTSVSQNDDSLAKVGTVSSRIFYLSYPSVEVTSYEQASSTPANGVGVMMGDTKKKTMDAVAKHILKEYGSPDKQDHVDGMIKHLSFRLDDVFASELDGAKLHAALEARKQSLSGDHSMSEKWRESSTTQTEDLMSEVARSDPTTSEANHIYESSGESISHGRKRARSSSSDNALSECQSNRPRKAAGTNIGEKLPAEATGASQEVRVESPNDPREGVASTCAGGDLFPSDTKDPVPAVGENGTAGNKASGQTQSDSAGKTRGSADGLSESQSLLRAGSPISYPFQVADTGLPPLRRHSYHPSQPYEIISVVEGSSMGVTQDVRFELDDEQLTLVKRWANRYDIFECVYFFVTRIK